jgi:hypothetical protein
VSTAWLSPGLGTVASLLLSSRLYGRPPNFTVSGSSELRLLELRGLVPVRTFTAGGELRPALKDFIVGYCYPPKSLTASNLRNVSALAVSQHDTLEHGDQTVQRTADHDQQGHGSVSGRVLKVRPRTEHDVTQTAG